jgi:hypothetical protein
MNGRDTQSPGVGTRTRSGGPPQRVPIIVRRWLSQPGLAVKPVETGPGYGMQSRLRNYSFISG